ncbi:pilus assembly protein FimV [Polynucleobacter meluiroseus]|uniref:Pilus assembly protein FimV n=1 Tax=Polynucleobacter meluiroseus TaxID=1938814 RepID=A0A240E219_9BURK|nr:FimV/HubP family polar landmark protein [Polynucleobacter meluiroseus]SNX28526.1 pilus assembly protein FimV [Polynucleobacter meluiroseus]
MSFFSTPKILRLAVLSILLCLSYAATAVSLGSPLLLSQPGEPLRVEIPIRLDTQESDLLSTLEATIPSKVVYERLGISAKVLDFNIQSMVYRNAQEKLMVLVETVKPIPISDDPFTDLLINLKWSSGEITKAFTLLLGDSQKIIVKSGQTLSEVAAQMAPQLDGASLDQAMLALFKANPDAFASGNINRLQAGAELAKPNQALLRSISPAEARQFVAESNAEWQAEKDAQSFGKKDGGAIKDAALANSDRLKIGSSTDGNAQELRYTEELVAQEKVLEQTKERVAELEKNIADLQLLIEKAKTKSTPSNWQSDYFGGGTFAPAAVALTFIIFTGLLLWFLARNARRSEMVSFNQSVVPTAQKIDYGTAVSAMPARAKALFAGIDLNLSPKKIDPRSALSTSTLSNDAVIDTLRVKLNLARAYMTIEDFSAAKKTLEEVALMGSVDPVITLETQELLSELSSRLN